MPRLTLQKRWIIPAAVCFVFVVVVYVISLRYLVPYAEIAQSVETGLRSRGIQAKIEGVGPSLLVGARADRITLSFGPASDRRAEIRDATVRVSLASLLRLHLRAALDASAFGGVVHANWPMKEGSDLAAEWDDLDLRKMPLPPNLSAAAIRGISDGRLKAWRPGAGGAGVAGFLEASIADAKFGPGNIAGLPIPAVSLGNGKVRLAARENKLVVEALKFEGGNLAADFTGTVGLDAHYPANPVEGVLSLRPDDRAAADLGFFLAFFPGGRASDGTYSARVTGTLGALALTPKAVRQ